MARRILVIALFMVLAPLAMGCHHKHFLFKKHLRGGCCEPVADCSCCGSSPLPAGAVAPLPVIEPLPAPKRMPSTEMTGRERAGWLRQ